jgi:hypothetical protein
MAFSTIKMESTLYPNCGTLNHIHVSEADYFTMDLGGTYAYYLPFYDKLPWHRRAAAWALAVVERAARKLRCRIEAPRRKKAANGKA